MASNQAFNTIQVNKPRRTAFDLSHSRKFTMNMGDLVPCLVQEVIPGDSFQLSMETLIRFMPMIAPIYHNINVYTHFFFVPNRLVWDDFEDFITGGREGTSMPVFPKIQQSYSYNSEAVTTNFFPGSLTDYMGLPVDMFRLPSSGLIDFNFSLLPFRAYQMIYNEYYRDQNLMAPVPFSTGSGNLGIAANSPLLALRKRAWEKDYFTSALPWTQRGAQMSIPIAGNAPVMAGFPGDPGFGVVLDDKINPVTGNRNVISFAADDEPPLYADMSSVSSSTINELRQAFQIQKWLERSARSGARYVEQILSHFGVRSSDARLDRPEYLGGGKTPVAISEVLQTSESGETPLAEFAGHGISYGTSNRFRKFFEEHGFVIGIISVLPRTGYIQGQPRIFNKYDKYDYYWPEFAHLGEQAIAQRELYYNPQSAEARETTFGYTGRYNEYRYVPDTVHGYMKNELDFWHLARKFQFTPVLNQEFVAASPSHRIFAVTDPTEHKLIVQTYNNLKAIRPIPRFGTPGGI